MLVEIGEPERACRRRGREVFEQFFTTKPVGGAPGWAWPSPNGETQRHGGPSSGFAAGETRFRRLPLTSRRRLATPYMAGDAGAGSVGPGGRERRSGGRGQVDAAVETLGPGGHRVQLGDHVHDVGAELYLAGPMRSGT